MGADLTKGLFYGSAEFKSSDDIAAMSDKDRNEYLYNVDHEIRMKQLFGVALVWINYLLVVLAGFISLISGYCTGGQPVTFGSMPHHVWYIPSQVILPLVLVAFYFDSTADYPATASYLMVGIYFILVLAAINLIHGVSLIIELADKTSIFYQQNGAAWVIVLLVASFVFVLWEAWIAWRMYVYRHDIVVGIKSGWRPGMLLQNALNPETVVVEPSAPDEDELKEVESRINFSISSSYSNNTKPGMIHAAAARVGLVTTTKPKDN